MKKGPVICIVLLVVSVVFNAFQFYNSKLTKEKLLFFETYIGSYEQFSGVLEQEEERDRALFVHIKENTSEFDVSLFQDFLEGQDLVQSIKYVSAEEALLDYKEKYKDDQLTLQVLEDLGYNPVTGVLIVSVFDPTQKQTLVNLINASSQSSIIDEINY